MSISNYMEEKLLNVVFNNSAVGAIAQTYIKLHLGDPGEDCTANPAANTTRQAASWANAANPGGTCATDADVIWTSVPNAETYAWISVWDAATVGNALWYGQLTAPVAVTVGQTFTLTSGATIATLA